MYINDIIIGDGVEKDAHEWQQSENGFAWLIERFTQPGDLIFDPFSGSGTCAVVAKRMTRRCVACDIDEAACATTMSQCSGGGHVAYKAGADYMEGAPDGKIQGMTLRVRFGNIDFPRFFDWIPEHPELFPRVSAEQLERM